MTLEQQEEAIAEPKTPTLGAVVPVPASVDPDRYALTLPSGAVAHILKRSTGKHVRLINRMLVGRNPADMRTEMLFASIAVKVVYDGRSLTPEDVEQLPEADVWTLIGRVGKALA